MEYRIQGKTLKDIADSIRSVDPNIQALSPQEMDDEIRRLTAVVDQTYDSESSNPISGKAVKQAIDTLSEKPDYNQNDSTAKNYIKNRPFYSEISEVTLLDGTFDFVEAQPGLYFYSQDSSLTFEEGKTYTVIFDGTSYNCTCYIINGATAVLGNASLFDPSISGGNNEPFLMIANDPGPLVIGTNLTSDSHTVKITGPEEVVKKKLDAKYLPDEIREIPSSKMDKENPTGTGSFSLNRKAGTIIGDYSFAEGRGTTASGPVSHAEGSATVASGYSSHAEGYNTTASDGYSHAEGWSTNSYSSVVTTSDPVASQVITPWKKKKFSVAKRKSHVEGEDCLALGDSSHAEGFQTIASGSHAHAEGSTTHAQGQCSHAEGSATAAYGNYSHAEGSGTEVSPGCDYQHVQGRYNIADASRIYADIIGNGTSSKRSNAATVDWSGNAWYAGNVYVGSTSGTNKDAGSKKLATEEYVDNSTANIDIPTTLPNPKSLTFTGAVNASYDGSSEMSVKIPGALSDLSEDATHHVVTDAEKAKWNAKSNFSGSYNDLTDKPTIPDVPVQSVNGKTGAVVLSAEDVGALPGSTVIPTALPNPNALTFTGAVTGSYDGSKPLTVEIPSAPTVPENISAFKNDVGYLTKHQDISGKIDSPASGVVGQVLAVKTVDENGKPTEFDCVYQTSGVTIPIVDSVDEMVDTSKQYILKSTGTIWAYKSSATEQEVTITDELDDTTYYDNSRLGSSATGLTDGFHNDATGYHVTPLIDLTKAEYQGKTIQIHLEGAKYITSAVETWIQHRYYKTNGSLQYARGASSPSDSSSMGVWKNATITINSETSATIEIAMPLLCGSANVQCGYLRFCGKGAVADSHIYITYKEMQTVISEQWVDTGIQYGGGGLDEETAAKISELNNEGTDPTTIKLLVQPVLNFYNASAYSDNDYTYSHLSKITYPCRADIPIPFTVKWNHNEDAMRTTVAVDTKAIGTLNAYTMRTYDATGFDNYPLYNLLPNTTYYYKVTHVLSDGSLVEAKSGSFTTSAESWRLLYIEGTQNVRDLGGWTGLNGKKVKYGKIIRGAAFSDSSFPGLMLTGKGRQALGELKIQAELNLGAVDSETSIAPNCAYKKVYYTNYAIAITDSTYRTMFKTLLEYIVSCLNGTLTEGGLSTVERNIYMHCQGGCDRTGTLSFLLLGLLGVSESDLAKEYELSSFSDVGFGRLRTTTKAVDGYDYVGMVEALKTYSGDTITDKFVDFAINGCGVSSSTIDAFRALMLE